MRRKPRSQRNRCMTSGASAEVSSANKFMPPTSGLNNVMFTGGTTRNAAKFMDTVKKLACHVGTQTWSQSTVAAKAIIELAEPELVEPTKPVRKYYLAVPDDEEASDPRAQTNDRFEVLSLKDNIKVVDNIEWKMTLH